eukprot:4373709-Pleurochrysis_carterae.AAC.1
MVAAARQLRPQSRRSRKLQKRQSTQAAASRPMFAAARAMTKAVNVAGNGSDKAGDEAGGVSDNSKHDEKAK